uniref:Uncharacterized protein n=1 Tax=Trichogramma kaykai TaxID=54128 RepID=A0ABD2VWX3_9HYME
MSRRRWHDGRVRELQQQQQHSPRVVDIMQCTRALHHTLYVSIGLRTICIASAAAAPSHRVIESLRLKLTASAAMWLKPVTPAGPRRSLSSRAAARRISLVYIRELEQLLDENPSCALLRNSSSQALFNCSLRTIVSLTTRRTRGFACAAMSTTRRECGSERMNELQNFLITMHACVSSIVQARLWASNAIRRDELCDARLIASIVGSLVHAEPVMASN